MEAGVEIKPDGSFELSKLEKEQYYLIRYLFAEEWSSRSLVWQQNKNR